MTMMMRLRTYVGSGGGVPIGFVFVHLEFLAMGTGDFCLQLPYFVGNHVKSMTFPS